MLCSAQGWHALGFFLLLDLGFGLQSPAALPFLPSVLDGLECPPATSFELEDGCVASGILPLSSSADAPGSLCLASAGEVS